MEDWNAPSPLELIDDNKLQGANARGGGESESFRRNSNQDENRIWEPMVHSSCARLHSAASAELQRWSKVQPAQRANTGNL
jgi:hypothetical protein